MARKKKATSPGNHDRWLVSYADFVTLLFCFFTAMYAIGESNASKAAKFITSIDQAFTPAHRRASMLDRHETSDGRKSFSLLKGGAGLRPKHRIPEDVEAAITARKADSDTASSAPAATKPTATPAPQTPPAPALPSAADAVVGKYDLPSDLQHAYEEIERVLGEKNLEDKILLVKDKRGLVISLKEAGFFRSGEADLQPESKTSLDQILPSIKELGREIEIEGHTDNEPIAAGRSKYSSNHELSTTRASSTFDFLVRERGFDPSKIRIAGYGEYRPAASNATAEGRARNRRVDIIIRSAQVE